MLRYHFTNAPPPYIHTHRVKHLLFEYEPSIHINCQFLSSSFVFDIPCVNNPTFADKRDSLASEECILVFITVLWLLVYLVCIPLLSPHWAKTHVTVSRGNARSGRMCHCRLKAKFSIKALRPRPLEISLGEAEVLPVPQWNLPITEVVSGET